MSHVAFAAVAPLRVMHVVAGFGYQGRTGGMEHNVIKVANGLVPAGITTSVAVFRPPDAGISSLLDPTVQVHSCGHRDGTSPRMVWALSHFMREWRPDIVHTHGWGTLVEGFIAARVAGVPHIVHGEHGTMQLKPHQRVTQRMVWARVDRLLSVSSRLAERMARDIGFPHDRITVIRNGVNLDRFRTPSRGPAREALGLPGEALLVGTVGRLVPVKDHPSFVRAIGVLRGRGHDVQGVIAGDGPGRDDLEAFVRAEGLEDAVHRLGYRPDVEQVMAALDVFVLSSSSEGLSNTILEAMASGRPVVATRVGGADELVVEGESGVLVPPGDPTALADGLLPLVADRGLRDRMGAAAQRRALGEFSLSTMIDNYGALYREVSPSPGVHGGARPAA